MDTGAEDSSMGNHRNGAVLVKAGVSSVAGYYSFEMRAWNAWRSTYLFSSFKTSSDDFHIELDEGSATTESGRALSVLDTGQYEHSLLPEELQPN